MEKTVSINGQTYKLATITVGALETIELAGKEGAKFNTAFVAASLLAAGDSEHGNEAWVRNLPVFGLNGEKPAFMQLMEAANEVNGFRTATAGEKEPEAPAAG